MKKRLYSKDDCDAEPQCNSATATCDSSACQKTSYIWCSSSYGCQSSDDPAVCEADPECDLDYTPNAAKTLGDITHAASGNLGFGGHNACVSFRKLS